MGFNELKDNNKIPYLNKSKLSTPQCMYSQSTTMSISCLLSFFASSWLEIIFALASFFLIPLFFKRHHQNGSLFYWPILGTLPSLLLNSNQVHDWFTHILKKNGSTVLLTGPSWLTRPYTMLTSDPTNVYYILITNFSNYPKGLEYSEIFDILGDGIFNADSDSWKLQRHTAISHVNSSQFRQHLAETNRKTLEMGLIPLLDQLTRRGEIIDLQDVLLRFTFDNICALVFGIDTKCLLIDCPKNKFVIAVDDAEEAIFSRYILPGRVWKLLRFLKVGKEKKLAKAKETIDQFITQCISQKREELGEIDQDQVSEKASRDLLTSYMICTTQLQSEIGREKYDKYLRDTTLNLLIAGRDTTSASLTWFFLLIAKNPTVETKIVNELRSKFGDKYCSEKPIVFETSDLCGLVYLHAALCESLRLYPPLPIDQKGVLKKDVLPSGEIVKPGHMVMYSIYAMGRMEWIWGEDCLEYKPERWITKKGFLKFEASHKFLAFNAGPRSCLGKDVALAQMKAVAAAVLYNFQIQVLENQSFEPKNSVMLFMKHGLMVKLSKRSEK